ncbi:MAG: hypothetical protein GY852_11240, partial [bacterium]|nr:hypothetical protein [bacterium]
VRIHHMMKKKGRAGTTYVDLKDSPELHYLVVSGAHYVTAEREYGYSYEERGGKPIYITEYNSHYELGPRSPFFGKLYSLRETLNIAQYLQTFARQEIQVATQWLLYGDMYGFGLIEGVGIDPDHGSEKGRDDPRFRPSYYVLELYREHLQGAMLPVEVQSSEYHVGPPAPYVGMGFVGHKPKELPYL